MQLFGKRRYVVLAFALLVVFWGSSFSVVKVGLEYAPPMLFAGLRTLLGGSVMVVAALVWGGNPHIRRDWPVFLLLSAFNVVFFIGFQTLAILNLPSGTAAVLVYLQPILVGLLAWLILGEALPAAKVVGLVLGFLGIVAVSVEGLSGSISAVGVMFGAGSAFFWAMGTVFFKRFQGRVSAMWAVALPFLIGGVVLTTFSRATERWAEVSLTGSLFASLGYAALIGVALAWLIWFTLVQAGEASRVSAYIFFVPLAGIIIGALFLDERLTASLLIGAALIVFGIYLVNRTPTKESV